MAKDCLTRGSTRFPGDATPSPIAEVSAEARGILPNIAPVAKAALHLAEKLDDWGRYWRELGRTSFGAFDLVVVVHV